MQPLQKKCSGKTCQNLITNNLNPCDNQGKCVEDQKSSKINCECVNGWTGLKCEDKGVLKNSTKQFPDTNSTIKGNDTVEVKTVDSKTVNSISLNVVYHKLVHDTTIWVVNSFTVNKIFVW